MTSPMTKSPRHPGRLAIACLLALACTIPGRAGADDRFDLRDWLRRPGVRLVVVEFYATWCKPCMAAVPKWKALHEKYRDQGLRLIVVNTQDPEGRCVNPGWNPDQMVCDEEGCQWISKSKNDAARHFRHVHGTYPTPPREQATAPK